MATRTEKTSSELRTRLAVAVKSIQWSYGIFWASSTTKQGTLEWNEGYYNGEIKTRKTVQAMVELKADKIGLQRSEQLRELYQFLLVCETDSQAKRPSAALSPEDLTDLEWYYLVCMSFMFNRSQSLPGRALEKGETIWLCNAQYVDSKVFSRALLAKSASIQTVVCFPYLGGVIEIGTTETVAEDLNLIQHVKTCFLEFSKPICSEKPSSALNKEDEDKDPTCTKVDASLNDYDKMTLGNRCCSLAKELQEDNNNEEFNMDSSEECCNGCDHPCQMEDSMLECTSGAQDSLSSDDCISEALEKRTKEVTNIDQCLSKLTEVHEYNHSKLSSLEIGTIEDLHYTRTLGALLGNSLMFKGHPHTSNSNWRPSFVPWKNGKVAERAWQQLNQSMLKKILFTVPLRHNRCFSPSKSPKEHDRTEFHRKLDSDGYGVGKDLSDERRESENYYVLKSMFPSINEMDKISILNDTIKYMKELEAKVEELESCMDIADSETRMRSSEVMEQTSDNCGIRKVFKAKKRQMNKRKACDTDESGSNLNGIIIKEGKSWDVTVDTKEQEVVIEMKCPYREFILLEIMDAISNMHLEAHSVQSSTVDGFLKLTLKSKFRGTAFAPTRMIYETLWKVCDKT